MRKLPLIEIIWDDISGQSGWDTLENVKKTEPVVCTTVGWQVKSTAKKLIVVSTHSDNKTYSDRNTIPKGCIKSIRRIE